MMKIVYATVYDLPRPKYRAINPRHTTFRVESYTVNIRYTTCRICDSMRHVVFSRIETVVLQVIKINPFLLIYSNGSSSVKISGSRLDFADILPTTFGKEETAHLKTGTNRCQKLCQKQAKTHCSRFIRKMAIR